MYEAAPLPCSRWRVVSDASEVSSHWMSDCSIAVRESCHSVRAFSPQYITAVVSYPRAQTTTRISDARRIQTKSCTPSCKGDAPQILNDDGLPVKRGNSKDHLLGLRFRIHLWRWTLRQNSRPKAKSGGADIIFGAYLHK
jgi:hypothetical protein